MTLVGDAVTQEPVVIVVVVVVVVLLVVATAVVVVVVVVVVCEQFGPFNVLEIGSFVLPDIKEELEVVFRSLDSLFSIEDRWCARMQDDSSCL